MGKNLKTHLKITSMKPQEYSVILIFGLLCTKKSQQRKKSDYFAESN